MKRVIAAAALVVATLILGACGGSTGSFSREAFYNVRAGDSEQQVRAEVGKPEAVVSRSDDPALDVSEESWLWVQGGTLYRVHFSSKGQVRDKEYGPCLARLHEVSLCGDV